MICPPADGSGFSVSNRGHDRSDRIFGNVGQLIGQRTGDISCIQLDRHCEAPRSLHIRYHHTGKRLELQEIENHTQESGKQCKAGPTLRKPTVSCLLRLRLFFLRRTERKAGSLRGGRRYPRGGHHRRRQALLHRRRCPPVQGLHRKSGLSDDGRKVSRPIWPTRPLPTTPAPNLLISKRR